MSELLKSLQARRLTAWETAKALLDTVETEGRAFTAEEDQTWSTINTDIEAIDARMGQIIEAEQRAAAHDEFMANYKPAPGARSDEPTGFEAEVRRFLTGERRSLEVTPDKPIGIAEFRDLSKLTAGAGANTVKTSFYNQLMAHLIEVSGVMAAGPTVLQTATGEQIQVPKTTSHSTAALTAEAGAITESDPVSGQVPLDAYKYAVLIQVSSELVTDTSVDLLGYLAMQAGRAVGNAFGAHAVTGTGSSQPNGVVTASTLGVTSGTGVAGVFTTDNLIDLFYSVIAPYRNSPSCGWMMRDASVATLRKLKDTTGQYIWQPGLVGSAPDTVLGKPLRTDPNVAATAVNAKSVLFGDFSQYFVRMVQGIRFERSDEYAFNSDLVTFRCILRADGDLVDTTGAVKHHVGAAT